MTGRAAGYCAGYAVPGYMNSRRGYGRGWGRGFGRGWGRGGYVYPPPAIVQPTYPRPYPPATQHPSAKQEVEALETYQKELVAEKADLEKEMDDIKSRITALKEELGKTKEPQAEN